MKKIIILAVALFAIAGTAVAQKAAKQIVTTVFVTDIDCEGCAKKIYDHGLFQARVLQWDAIAFSIKNST